jgi:hypothetical protein
MHLTIDTGPIIRLYRPYAADLDRVREKQRKPLPPPTSLKAQLDGLEAEITYLLLREARPETVVEIGTFHGWSTTWIFQALRDNGTGHLFIRRPGPIAHARDHESGTRAHRAETADTKFNDFPTNGGWRRKLPARMRRPLAGRIAVTAFCRTHRHGSRPLFPSRLDTFLPSL